MIRLTVRPADPEHIDALCALMSEYETDGAQMFDDGFEIYMRPEIWHSADWQEALAGFAQLMPFASEAEPLPEVNWNEEWERHFPPVIVDDFLTIRASFHDLRPETKHTIIIDPRMSFGTGHHATTWMMARMLQRLYLKGHRVLDAGCGTGVLAILAVLEGAERAVAFDCDPWCKENARENVQVNGVDARVDVLLGDLHVVQGEVFDTVLANIHRNFLLDEVEALLACVGTGGKLVVSGFYEADVRLMLDCYAGFGLVAQYLQLREGWACMAFQRNEVFVNT